MRWCRWILFFGGSRAGRGTVRSAAGLASALTETLDKGVSEEAAMRPFSFWGVGAVKGRGVRGSLLWTGL